MRNYILLLAFILSFSALKAQPDFVYENNVYVDNIATVQFGADGFQHLFPMLTLGVGGQFLLSFDDMDAGVKDYVYTVIHCDRNWTPSDLNSMEYIDGFDEDDIYEYHFSFKTYQTYTHYDLWFPNNNMDVTKTGNYLLVVYEDEYDKIPVITRRFVVVDNQVAISSRFVRPAKVSQLHSHQEIDFTVNYNDLNVRNPMLELRATVIQNQRWDNALTEISPKFIRSNDAIFDYQSQIVFPAVNEFRFLDLRSLRGSQSEFTYMDVVMRNDGEEEIEAVLEPQISRKKSGVHLSYVDINGGYVIENFDEGNAHLNGQYPNVVFTYKVDQPYINDDIYLIGGITDWQIKQEYKLIYNPAVSAYVGRFPFKMGYYNYLFATVPSDRDLTERPIPSTAKTEGNFADTENSYIILIYYKPFGSRYDQIVGVHQLNSADL